MGKQAKRATRLLASCARLVAALAGAALLLANAPASASGEIAGTIRSEADYATAFDRETDGLFGTPVASGDPVRTLEGYASLVAAYGRIEDALFEAWSPHANSLPSWYAGQLLAMGVDELGAETGAAEEHRRFRLVLADVGRAMGAM